MNRIPSKPLHNKSPYELLYGHSPALDHLKIIGCQAYVHQHSHDKFASRSIPSVLIGYSPTKKGYLLYDLSTHKIITSRHVQFDESIFPFQHPLPPINQNSSPVPTPHFESFTLPTLPNSHPSSPSSHTLPPVPNPSPLPPNIPSPSPPNIPSSSPNPPPVRISQRHSKPPSHLHAYKFNLPNLKANSV